MRRYGGGRKSMKEEKIDTHTHTHTHTHTLESNVGKTHTHTHTHTHTLSLSAIATPETLAAFRPYRGVFLVNNFRQQRWLRFSQVRPGANLYWAFPICEMFFLQYYGRCVPHPQFYIRDRSVFSRVSHAAGPICGNEREE